MASLPTGSRIAVATSIGAKVPITAITNATEAVCTAAGHGLAVGNIVIILSGWGRLNGLVFRVKAVPTPDTFTLEALNDEVLMQDGQVNRVKADFSGKGRSTRYAS